MKDVRHYVLYFIDQIWRRRWIALLFAWGVCLVGWTLIASLPDRYTSTARFYVDTLSLLNPLLRGISVNADERGKDQEVAVMQRTLTSRPNLMKVAQMTDLDKTVDSEGDLQALITSLENRISVRSQGQNLFVVEFTDNSPAMARNVVQALLTIFVESSVGNKRDDIQTAKSFIETQISEYETQLKEAEQKLADFKVKNVQYFSSSTQSFAARLEMARENVKTQKLEYEDTAAQLNQIRRQVDRTPQFLAVDSAPQFGIGDTPQRQRIKTLQARLDELRLQYTEKHPDVVQAKQSLRQLLEQQQNGRRADLDDIGDARARWQIPNELHSQLSLKLADAEGIAGSAKRKYEESQARLEDLQKIASEAPRVEAEFTNLNRDYEVLKANYEGLLQRRESARISAAADSTTEPVQFRLIAAPELPAAPAGPKRRLFNTAVLIVGLAAGIGFVILLTQVEDRVTAPGDLFELGDFRVLGCVSPVVTETQRLIFARQLGQFGAAMGGLGAVFALLLLTAPNLSNFVNKVTLRVWS